MPKVPPRRKNTFSDKLKAEFTCIIQTGNDNTLVKCTVCNVEFNISIGGRASITKHTLSNKHKSCLDALSSSKKIENFIRRPTFTSQEKKLAIAEGTMAFHTIKHNQSFRSMDCTSKIIRKLFDNSFACARTKCERIVVGVFQKFANNLLAIDLEQVKFLSILSDASNHKEIKLYPILVRYFNFENGVQNKILNLSTVDGETSDILSDHIFKTAEQSSITKKIFAFSADNTNTNFGGINRRGENNVHKKLMSKLNRSIIGIGCNAHIISNTINTASSVMTIDAEIIIPQVYLHFHRYTVRVTTLQEFCREADVEYKKLLGFSKVRWLALTPAIERVIKLYEPLRSYFLSLDKCPKILKKFFESDESEVMLFFIHNQAVNFNSAIKQIEKSNITVAEVLNILDNLKEMYVSRYNNSFIPIFLNSKINKLEESNPGLKQRFLKEILLFYKTCFEYISKWTEQLHEFQCFQWTILNKKIEWNDMLETVRYLGENNVIINDEELFDEVRRTNIFCEDNGKFLNWVEEKIEVDKRWLEVFKHFKSVGIPHANLKNIIEAAMCLPGTTANVERTFSLINDFWSCEKSNMNTETLAAVITTKENLKYTCTEFSNLLAENDQLTREIHSSNKYEK